MLVLYTATPKKGIRTRLKFYGYKKKLRLVEDLKFYGIFRRIHRSIFTKLPVASLVRLRVECLRTHSKQRDEG